MCDFGIGVAVALGAASAAAQADAQNKAAKEQNAYRARLGVAGNKQYRENAEAVIRDVGSQVDQVVRQNIERSSAVRQELEGISRNAREAKATYTTVAASAGVEGRSVDLLHAQFDRDVMEFESAAARNLSNMRTQMGMEIQAIYARGQSAINGGYPAPLPPAANPSPWLPIINGITTGISTYGALQSFQTPGGVGSQANQTVTPPPPSGLIPGIRSTPPSGP
jgi:O-acetyl-ADP-ribose deacetylase (regulator of RNase III)